MIRIKWILDDTPSEQSTVDALRKVYLLDAMMGRHHMQSLQKIWTDGQYFFHYKRTKIMRQLRVWVPEELPGLLRFWVYADGKAWGITYNGSKWDKVELDDMTILPPAFTYVWTSTNGDYMVSPRMDSDEDMRHFYSFYQQDIWWGHYARVGGLNSARNTYGALYFRGGYVEMTDLPGAAARTVLTQYNSSHNPLDADQLQPFLDVTTKTPQEVYQSTDALYINHTKILNDDTKALHDNGLVLLCTYKLNWSYLLVPGSSPVEYYRASNQVLVQPRDRDIPYGKIGNDIHYAITADATAAIQRYAIAKDSFNGAGTQFVGHGEINITDAGLGAGTTVTGNNILVTLDHGAETAAAAALDLIYHKGVTVGTTTDSGTTTVAIDEVTTYTGYGFLGGTTLSKAVIRHTANREIIYSGAYATNDMYIRDWTVHKVEVIIDSVVVVTHTHTPAGSELSGWQRQNGAVYTENFDEQSDGFQVIVNDIDLNTGSFSIGILIAETTFANLVTTNPTGQIMTTLSDTYDIKYTYTEYTRTSGEDQTTATDNATVSVVAGSSVLVYALNFSDIPADGFTEEDSFSIGSGEFPTIIGVTSRSTGFGANFIRDKEGNVLSYCPTAQESYWFLKGDSANIAPTKWTAARPTVFKLYDSSGTEINISHLGFTDVETIGACDGFTI